MPQRSFSHASPLTSYWPCLLNWKRRIGLHLQLHLHSLQNMPIEIVIILSRYLEVFAFIKSYSGQVVLLHIDVDFFHAVQFRDCLFQQRGADAVALRFRINIDCGQPDDAVFIDRRKIREAKQSLQ